MTPIISEGPGKPGQEHDPILPSRLAGLLLLALLIGGCRSPVPEPSPSPAGGWAEYLSAEGGFSVLMPRVPDERTETSQGRKTVVATAGDCEVYWRSLGPQDAGLTTEQIRARPLREVGTITRVTSTYAGGVLGVGGTVTRSDGSTVEMLVFLLGRENPLRMVVLRAGPADARRFLESFRPLVGPPGQPAPGL